MKLSVPLIAVAAILCSSAHAFTLHMMGGRRGKGNLKRSLDPSAVGDKGIKSSGGVAAL